MLKNYIYISRTKLATYWPQIIRNDTFKREGQKLKAELGFNLGGVSGKLAVEQLAIESSVGLCELVEKYIQKTERPGDLDSGSRWVSGELGVKYIQLGDSEDYFAFVGKYQDTALLFVGSRAHTNLAQSPQPVRAGFSHTPFIEQELLKSWLKEFQEEKERVLRVILERDGPDGNSNNEFGVGDFELASYIGELHRMAKRSTFRVSLLARRLFYAASDSSPSIARKFALYTPLYVAEE